MTTKNTCCRRLHGGADEQPAATHHRPMESCSSQGTTRA
jgi:hypothetical protein